VLLNEIKIYPTNFGKNKVYKTINAKELHQLLEVKSYFYDWITRKIEQYDFLEGQEYIKIIPNSKMSSVDNSGKFVPHEYYITISMAKELAMLENNPKGKEIRRYFIACESKLRKLKNWSQFDTLLENSHNTIITLQDMLNGQQTALENYHDAAVTLRQTIIGQNNYIHELETAIVQGLKNNTLHTPITTTTTL